MVPVAALIASLHSASPGGDLNSVYLAIYILLGLIALIGGGGLLGFLRWYRKQAVRDSKLDELIDPREGAMSKLRDIGRKLTEIDEQSRHRLSEHIDGSRAEHDRIWRAINKLENVSRHRPGGGPS